MAHFVIVNATTTSVPVIAAGVYDSYLVPTGASGDWSSQSGKIARGNGEEGYEYIALANGDTIFDKATKADYFYDSSASKVLSKEYAWKIDFGLQSSNITTRTSLKGPAGVDSRWARWMAPFDVTLDFAEAWINGGTVSDSDIFLSLDDSSDQSVSIVTATSNGARFQTTGIDADFDDGDTFSAYIEPGGSDSANIPSYHAYFRRRLYG